MQEFERLRQLVKVAELYYEYGQTQQDIASFLNLSRPTVSRLLKEAQQEGIVRIDIVNPLDGFSKLESTLEQLFGLKKAIVVPNFKKSEQETKQLLGLRAAKYINSIVRDGDTIAISWGTTLYELALKVQPKKVRSVQVVQCNGAIGRSIVKIHATEIMERISKAFNAGSYSLPTPAIVDNKQLAQMLKNENQTREILKLQETANIVLFSVGIPIPDSVLVEAGYFTPDDLIELKRKGAVGDIFSRYFTIDGQICDTDLNSRTIGMELVSLHRRPYSIAVAGGKTKARAIIGACRGGYVNVLITDEAAAEEVLALISKR